jgi:hypothetical protein
MSFSLIELAGRDEFPILVSYIDKNALYAFSFTCKAARGGHLDVLEWIFEEKYIYMSEVYKCAVEGGHVNVLQWARKKRIWLYNHDDEHSLSYIAANRGDRATLEWLRDNDFEWGMDTCTGAASGGHLETLKWLRAEGCEWGSGVYTCAVQNGHLPILKWASENGLSTENTDVCAYCAQQGNLEMLQWARANGFPWGYYTIRWAAFNNKLEILKWAHANGCTAINTRSHELYGSGISWELREWFKENLE